MKVSWVRSSASWWSPQILRSPQNSFRPISSTTRGNVASRSVASALLRSSITSKEPRARSSGCTDGTVPILVSVPPTAIEESLSRAEAAVAAGEGLAGTGFWRAVSEVKRRPELVDRYAERIAHIDARAHRNWALLQVPLGWGTLAAIVVTLGGFAAIWWSYYLTGWTQIVVFFVGMGILVGSTHSLAHFVVGRLLGIRFSYWFVGEVKQPQPGVKIDYSSYLRTGANRRAWMHASGAIVTKTIPFLLIGAAVAAGLPTWAPWALAGLGVAMLLTDVFWSTNSSDWKKFSRERTFA